MDGLLPAAVLRAEPPGQMRRARLALVLCIVPLCSYAWVQRLQGVASASSMSSTEWTACLAAAHLRIRHCRPAVGLPCWAIGAKPEDLLVAFQPGVVREVRQRCIVPLCQKIFASRVLAVCKGWLLDLLPGFCLPTTFPASSSVFADALTVRCTIICFIVPLSCK